MRPIIKTLRFLIIFGWAFGHIIATVFGTLTYLGHAYWLIQFRLALIMGTVNSFRSINLLLFGHEDNIQLAYLVIG